MCHAQRSVFGIRPLLELLISPDVKLVLALDGRPLQVDVDRVQLEQSLLNLASNANQAMANGGELRIATRPAGPGHGGGAELSRATHAVLTVSDTGAGMSREVQQRAFEPFFTTRPAGGGTGLGLSCVQQFVHDNDGFIELESEPGRGTSISLHLPLAAAAGRASTPPEHGSSCPPHGAL